MDQKPIVCIGAALIDESFYSKEEPIQGTSNPATYHRSAGGVARNIADYLARLGNRVELISHFGNDSEGKWLSGKCLASGIGISHSKVDNTATGRYTAIVSPSGELFIGSVATHFETEITTGFLAEKSPVLISASVLVLDCNLSAECLDWLLAFSRDNSVPCVIDPVSVAKATRLGKLNLENILLVTPNRDELPVLAGTSSDKNESALVELLLKKGIQKIWMRKGKEGSEIFSRDVTIELAAPVVNVVDITGAGDAALAGWVHAWLKKKNEKECLAYGHAMAEIILQTRGADSELVNANLLESKLSYQLKK